MKSRCENEKSRTNGRGILADAEKTRIDTNGFSPSGIHVGGAWKRRRDYSKLRQPRSHLV